MSKILQEVLQANAEYGAEFGDKKDLSVPPARRFAILTCMDARLDPARFAGLAEGDAHVIRNAGGRASDDAIRSLVISHKLLGTSEWFVIHHSDCGMATFTDDTIRTLQSTDAAGEGPGGAGQHYFDWLAFEDEATSVVEDIERIRNHPLVPGDIPIHGHVYDVRTGRLEEVPGAAEAGAPRIR